MRGLRVSAQTKIIKSTHPHVGSRLNNPVGARHGMIRASDSNCINQRRLAPPYGTEWSRAKCEVGIREGQKKCQSFGKD